MQCQYPMDPVFQQMLIEGNGQNGRASVLGDDRETTRFGITQEISRALTQITDAEYVDGRHGNLKCAYEVSHNYIARNTLFAKLGLAVVTSFAKGTDSMPSRGCRQILDAVRRAQLLAVDEAHNFLNKASQRSGILLRNLADRVVLFTATPINRGLSDLVQLVDVPGADNFDDVAVERLERLARYNDRAVATLDTAYSRSSITPPRKCTPTGGSGRIAGWIWSARSGMTDCLHAKLGPARFPNMSGLLLDRPCTEPALAEFIVTPDGAVLGRLEGEPSMTYGPESKGVAERYVILAGRARVEIGELAPAVLGPGDVVSIPPGIRQWISNTERVDPVFLAICTLRFTFCPVSIIAA